MARAVAVCGLVLLALAPGVAAHDTWLLPTRFAVEAGGSCRLEMTSGMAFPALDSAIRPDRVTRAALRLNGSIAAIRDLHPGRRALELSARPLGEGVAALWVELAPKALELSEAQVEEYLQEIGMAGTIGPKWRNLPSPKRWRETYRKHAKTFVRVGAAKGDASWSEPVGMALELVPEADPTSLAAGAILPIRLLRNGEPLAGLAVAVDRGGPNCRTFQTTDAEGRARLTLDLAGKWLLTATDLRQSASGSGWESDFTTLTLEVGPGR